MMPAKISPIISKPLGRKNYGSIGHLPCSRMGSGDHACHEGQQRIATAKARDKHDEIIVTEKVDGTNVGIARIGGEIIALGRAGYFAQSSKYEQHQLFAAWVREREDFWREVLAPGERLVGEWLAQAHSTLYTLPLGPFAAFDLMQDEHRHPFAILKALCERYDIPMPKLLHIGGPLSVEKAMELHGPGAHGCDEPEGAVWRVERKGEFDFITKWVRPDKIDGKYLPGTATSLSDVPVWNWRPERTVVGFPCDGRGEENGDFVCTKDRIVKAALHLDGLMNEFEGDETAVGPEAFEALWDACTAYNATQAAQED